MKNTKILKMTETAILIALLLVMNFTPLGFLQIGPLSLSFLMVPVAVGGVIVGWESSTVLGLVFGFLSFSTCFGRDPFGTLIMQLNPFGTVVTTIVARVLCGICCGLFYILLRKVDKHSIVGTAAACVSAALFNTLFFLGSLVLFFGNNADVNGYLQNIGAAESVKAYALAVLATNALWEVLACGIIGTAICLALKKALKHA